MTRSSVAVAVAVVEVAGDASKRPMDEDPDRSLGTPQDARDLGGRHLVNETKDECAAAVAGKAVDGAERRCGLCPAGCLRLEIGRPCDLKRGLERRLRAAANRPAALGDGVAGDLEE